MIYSAKEKALNNISITSSWWWILDTNFYWVINMLKLWGCKYHVLWYSYLYLFLLKNGKTILFEKNNRHWKKMLKNMTEDIWSRRIVLGNCHGKPDVCIKKRSVGEKDWSKHLHGLKEKQIFVKHNNEQQETRRVNASGICIGININYLSRKCQRKLKTVGKL